MEAGALIIAGLALLLIAAGLRRVPAESVLTVRRLGRYRRTLGPGWHWTLPGFDRPGRAVALIGHHLHVSASHGQDEAEVYYQILEPQKAGETLDQVDAWVTEQTREALDETADAPEQLKQAINRRVGQLGLRVIRCSLHVA